MKLSIITINYNNLEGLKKTAESVLSQIWRNFEWIIIDGGSDDGAKEYIESIASSKDSNIFYWCSEPDNGIYNALNKGMMHCNGEYVSCMNSGDVYYSHYTLAEVFSKENKATVLYGDAMFSYDSHEKITTYPNKMSFRWLYNDTINHQASFCKTHILKRYRFDESYTIMADRKLWLRLYLSGYSFRHIPLVVTKYDHSGISATDENKWMSEFHRLHDEIISPNIQKVRILNVLAKTYIEISCRLKSVLR